VTGLLRFEWRRMRSLRSTWVLLASMAAFAVLADLAALGRSLDAGDLVFNLVLRDFPVRWLLAAAVGAQAFGNDFRDGTIRPALLAFPRRGLLLAGRAVAAFGVCGAAAAAASALSLAVLVTVGDPAAGALADPALWRSVALGTVTAGLVAVLGVTVAVLTRGAGLAVVLLVLWAVGELLAVAVAGSVAAQLLPLVSLVGVAVPTAELGPPTPLAAAVCPLYLALLLVLAGKVLARRDATTR
jgi:ABC-2 type transport system permease protein